MSIMDAEFVNYFLQQCVIGVRDALGHHAGQLRIKSCEDDYSKRSQKWTHYLKTLY
jgi:hypothetical protein